MTELNAWQRFCTTGFVLDYLTYRSIQNTKDLGADTVNREETDEVPDRRTDNKRTEYR